MISGISGIGSSYAGVERALTRFDKAAQEIARPEGDLVKGTVEMTEAKATFEANLAVIKTADEMKGTLIDIVA